LGTEKFFCPQILLSRDLSPARLFLDLLAGRAEVFRAVRLLCVRRASAVKSAFPFWLWLWPRSASRRLCIITARDPHKCRQDAPPAVQCNRRVRRSRLQSPRFSGRAKRVECAQLAAALGCRTSTESAVNPDALQALRDLDASETSCSSRAGPLSHDNQQGVIQRRLRAVVGRFFHRVLLSSNLLQNASTTPLLSIYSISCTLQTP